MLGSWDRPHRLAPTKVCYLKQYATTCAYLDATPGPGYVWPMSSHHVHMVQLEVLARLPQQCLLRCGLWSAVSRALHIDSEHRFDAGHIISTATQPPTSVTHATEAHRPPTLTDHQQYLQVVKQPLSSTHGQHSYPPPAEAWLEVEAVPPVADAELLADTPGPALP